MAPEATDQKHLTDQGPEQGVSTFEPSTQRASKPERDSFLLALSFLGIGLISIALGVASYQRPELTEASFFHLKEGLALVWANLDTISETYKHAHPLILVLAGLLMLVAGGTTVLKLTRAK